jgi:hypothetical protein
MYIEELIDRVANNGPYIFNSGLPIFKADATIAYSLSDQVQRGNGYTEKQRALAIKLVSKYAKILSDDLKYDVQIDIQTPKFKYPVRKLSGAKLVQVINIENLGKVISVQFPFNDSLVETFRSYKAALPKPSQVDINWDSEKRAWLFGFTESNISFLYKTLSSDFTFDAEVVELAHKIQKVEENLENYVPMVVFNNGKFSFKNTSNKIPQPTSDNLISVLLHARKYGVTCWDDSIDLALHSDEINPTVRSFVKNTSGNPLIIEGQTLHGVDEIVNFSQNVLFVIPGGSEIEHLKSINDFLISKNVPSEQISVMFRLDSSSGKLCNDYIKENKLNSSLSEETRFICVSGKIPKPLIESGKKFDLVLHFGTNSAHYTLKEYIRNHHNVISMTLDNKNKELKFVQL